MKMVSLMQEIESSIINHMIILTEQAYSYEILIQQIPLVVNCLSELIKLI